jgi:antitoxin component YwqK of YwqJK toxin-antitoxin module
MIDGSYDYYFPNGLPMISGSFKNGMKNGLWEKWTSNGKRKSVGIYHKNHEVGEWKYYDGEGELTMVKKFGKDGLLTNQIDIK